MRKVIPAITAGAVVLAVAGGALGFAGGAKAVTLAVDGSPREVSTRAGTVAGVLSDQGIVVGDHDRVSPELDATLAEGQTISVRYGRPLTVITDGRTQHSWVTAQTVGSALAELEIETTGDKVSTGPNALIGRNGLSVKIATLKAITVKQGKKSRVVKTTATNVAETLVAAKIELDGDDELSAARTTAVTDGSTISVVDVATKKIKKTASIDFETTYKKTDRLTKGETSIDQYGRSGERTTTWQVTRKNGKVTDEKKLSSKITSEPVDKIVLVGTKKKESSSSGGGSNFASGSSVWDKLAKCESGGNWAINTGNGYSGGLQFSASTWRAYGGSGSAHNASRAEQIRIAEKIRADVGFSAWPACSRKLGL